MGGDGGRWGEMGGDEGDMREMAREAEHLRHEVEHLRQPRRDLGRRVGDHRVPEGSRKVLAHLALDSGILTHLSLQLGEWPGELDRLEARRNGIVVCAAVAELASGARLLGESLAREAPRHVAQRTCELQPIVSLTLLTLARLQPKAATPAAAASAASAASAALALMPSTRHAPRRAPRHPHEPHEAVLAIAADDGGEGVAPHLGVGPHERSVLILPRETRRAARTPALPTYGRRRHAHALHLALLTCTQQLHAHPVARIHPLLLLLLRTAAAAAAAALAHLLARIGEHASRDGLPFARHVHRAPHDTGHAAGQHDRASHHDQLAVGLLHRVGLG
jgi:hypothetical protein